MILEIAMAAFSLAVTVIATAITFLIAVGVGLFDAVCQEPEERATPQVRRKDRGGTELNRWKFRLKRQR